MANFLRITLFNDKTTHMKTAALVPVVISTIALLVFVLFHFTGVSEAVWMACFLLSPFLVGWMVYAVIRYDEYKGPDLEEGEEWGYGDKQFPRN